MEYLDICDEYGAPTGAVTDRDRAHREGIRHRTAHVWVVRRNHNEYEVLLQKRSMSKESFPGKYDVSSAGHIPAGDEPVASALRELREELGVCAGAEMLKYAGKFNADVISEFSGRPFYDREVRWVYVYTRPVDAGSLQLQEDEVDEVRWFRLEELCRWVQSRDERFCVHPGGLSLLLTYLNGGEMSWQ